uniref:Zinc finger protein 16-like n=1 Tax=Oryzias melastigma TaxID=30732 RepID=A0A3B3DD82_ORYME
MSSVHSLRVFISERLTSAAEEIFREFEKTIVQYEEEMDRQRRLLDSSWKRNTITADVRQLPVCKEDEELRSKEHLSQSPHIKEEQDDLCAEEEGGQPELKQESETFMLPSSSEERDLHAAEPTSEQLLSESQDQQQVKLEDFETMSPPSTFRRHSDATDIRRQPGEKSNFCEVCRKCFRSVSVLKVHMRIHTGEKPFFCQICGKRCRQQSDLGRHMMAHTGERKKPYSCKVCKKMFVKKAHLTAHARTHTGEKPFLCDTCGRGFINRSNLTRHKKVHTGEKPFICSVCLKTFSRNEHLWSHMMLHKGEGTLTSR